MIQNIFTEAQTDAAIDLSEKLFGKWSSQPDEGTRLLAAALFIAATVATSENGANTARLIEIIARQTAAKIDDIGVG